MEAKATGKSPLRLLLNAEPFGFGPSAAIAGFFPHLRPHFAEIGYIGKKHTLDLQKTLPYDAIHDVGGVRAEDMGPVFLQYDLLLTAMDHKVAEEARHAGLKVFYYDALAWYWPEIPPAVRGCDLYIAQDFFGVKARLKEVFAGAANACTVPPVAPEPRSAGVKKEHVLINLGGLQNPFWPVDEVAAYGRAAVSALRRALPAEEKIVIAASRAVAERMRDQGVRTYPRTEMEGVLAASKLAFMTPGLGNIYDAASFNLPTLWLPSANDSQGRQLALIRENGLCDGALDWPAILPGENADYHAPQPEALAHIAGMAARLAASPAARRRLGAGAQAFYRAASQAQGSAASGLIEKFGTGGERKVAELVVAEARRLAGKRPRHG
jgi:hypothetical protein